MTLPTLRSPRALAPRQAGDPGRPPFARRHRGLLGRAALVAVAVVLVLVPPSLDLPVWTALRLLVALPVLVGVLGESAVALLLGPRGPSRRRSDLRDDLTGPAEPAERADEDDRHLRVLLAPVLGLLGLLVAVGLLQAVQLRLSAVAVPVTVGVQSLVLLALRAVEAERRPAPAAAAAGAPGDGVAGGAATGPGGTLRPAAFAPFTLDERVQPRPWWRQRPAALLRGPGLRRLLRLAAPAVGVVVAGAVLAGAVYGANALQPQRVERFTVLQVEEPAVLRGQPLTARPGAAVEVRWSVRSTNWVLDGSTPQATVSVGDGPAEAVAVRAASPQAQPAADTNPPSTSVRQECALTLTAPVRPGLYRVDVSVVVPGAPDPTPMLATLDLEVTS